LGLGYASNSPASEFMANWCRPAQSRRRRVDVTARCNSPAWLRTTHGLSPARSFQDQLAAVRVSHHVAAIRESLPPRLRVGLVVLLRVKTHCLCGHLRAFCQSAQAGFSAKKRRGTRMLAKTRLPL
jgi:hypothetical protein